MKVRKVIKIIEQNGWFLVRQRSDHRQYKHPFKKGLVTIAGNLEETIQNMKETIKFLKPKQWLS